MIPMKRIISLSVKLARTFILRLERHISLTGEIDCLLEIIRVEVNLDKLRGKVLGEVLGERLGKTTQVLHRLSQT
jgi:hypothetical protein